MARPGSAAFVACISMMLAAGCGGGGGGGGGAAGGVVVAPAPAPANSFLTAEFQNQTGLAQINAQSAYARGATGAGITVAVIDTGVDIDHPDLAGNLSPASTDVVAGSSATVNDVDGHGTAVSGVATALRNDIGMHGVAFNARLLAVRADTAGACPSVSCGFSDADVAAGIDYAVAQGARVINLSLGGPPPSSGVLVNALANAAAAGVVLVIAAGNDAGANPLSPAVLATDPALRGLAIAVGAVDASNVIAGFSNRAGTAQAAYLVAPGVNIFTTAIGGGYARVSGTSFSAPHVAGAVALLLQLFPTLTPQQIVQLLYNTATDLGDPGDDPVYGQGLVNLMLAAQPQGALIVPLPSGGATLAQTSLSLGRAFGDALTANPLLAQTLLLDGLGRPFQVDLRDRLQVAGRGFRLEALAEGGRWRSHVLAPFEGARLSLGERDDGEGFVRDLAPFGQAEPVRRLESVSFAAEPADGMRIGFGYNLSSAEMLERPAAHAAFWDATASLDPGASLLGRGEGGSLTQALGHTIQISLAVFEGREDRDAKRALGSGRLVQAGVEQALGSGTIRFAVANVEEDEAFLGAAGTGAFAHRNGARSRFATLGFSAPLGPAELFGAFTAGSTEMPSGQGLLTDWAPARSDAFALGLAFKDVAQTGDRLGLLVGQPLRVRDAKATLTAPAAVDPSGAVLLQSERVNVAPSGREFDLQAAYSHSPAPGVQASWFLMMQRQPGHDSAAEPAYGAGMLLKVGF